jgi:formylglycine-generating enzyme required for sulfatase activity
MLRFAKFAIILTAVPLVVVIAFFPRASVLAVTIPTVPVGNPGNAIDPADADQSTPGIQNFGSVDHAYRIGTTEVTNTQYAEFLNLKAKSDPLGLYNVYMDSPQGGILRSGSSPNFVYNLIPGRENMPATFVGWYDAIRFVNWLDNGQENGDTETGAYTLLHDGSPSPTPVPSNALNIARNPGATWFLPSEDEWYKAAYH